MALTITVVEIIIKRKRLCYTLCALEAKRETDCVTQNFVYTKTEKRKKLFFFCTSLDCRFNYTLIFLLRCIACFIFYCLSVSSVIFIRSTDRPDVYADSLAGCLWGGGEIDPLAVAALLVFFGGKKEMGGKGDSGAVPHSPIGYHQGGGMLTGLSVV